MTEIPRIESTEPDLLQRHFAAFSNELIARKHGDALERIKRWQATEAVQLVLAAVCRDDRVTGEEEINAFADALGVFEDYWWPEDEAPAGSGRPKERPPRRLIELKDLSDDVKGDLFAVVSVDDDEGCRVRIVQGREPATAIATTLVMAYLGGESDTTADEVSSHLLNAQVWGSDGEDPRHPWDVYVVEVEQVGDWRAPAEPAAVVEPGPLLKAMAELLKDPGGPQRLEDAVVDHARMYGSPDQAKQPAEELDVPDWRAEPWAQLTFCQKCGKTAAENRSKYCGDGSDKDNPHQWRKKPPEPEAPPQPAEAVTEWVYDDAGERVTSPDGQIPIADLRGRGYLTSRGLPEERVREILRGNGAVIAQAPRTRRELASAKARLSELETGEHWARGVFVKIWAAAVAGFADAAIVGNHRMGPMHSLAAVEKLAEQARIFRTRMEELEVQLDRGVLLTREQASLVQSALLQVAALQEQTYGRDEAGNRDEDAPGELSGADVVDLLTGLEATVSAAVVVMDQVVMDKLSPKPPGDST